MATSIYELKLAQEKLEALQFLLTQVDELEMAINNFNSSGVKEFGTDIKNAKEQIIATKDEIKLTKSEFDTALQKFNQDLTSANAKVAELGNISTELKNNGIKTLLDEMKQLIRTKSDGIINDDEISSVCVYSSSKITQLVKQVKDEISLTIQQIVSESQEASLNIALDTKLDKNANAVSASKLETPRSISGIEFDGTKDITLKKENIGLNEVDNTSDLDKPISKAMQEELDKKVNLKNSYQKNDIDELLDSKIDKPKTYKKIRLLPKFFTNCKYAYQEMHYDRKTNELIKYGDIFVKGVETLTTLSPFLSTINSDWIKLSIPTNDEIIDFCTTQSPSANNFFVILPKDKNYFFTYGYNAQGNLGIGSVVAAVPTLQQVFTDAKIKSIYCFQGEATAYLSQMFVLLENGKILATGANTYGQLGIGTLINATTLTYVNIPDNEKVIDIKNSGQCFYAICKKENGKKRVYGWGANNQGSLKQSTNIHTPFVLCDDIDDFDVNNCQHTKLFIDTAWHITDGICYAIGACARLTNTADITIKRDFLPVVDNENNIINGVKKALLSNYISFVLCENGDLFVSNISVAKTLIGLDGGSSPQNNGLSLYAKNIDDFIILNLNSLTNFNIIIKTKDKRYYQATTLHRDTTLFSTKCSLENLVSTEIKMPYIGDFEFCSYALAVDIIDTTITYFFTDGKEIYTSGTNININSQIVTALQNFYSPTKITLARTEI
ncbi:hypothetical protein [Campylobacter californiensis]|uniref:hypothetical protein n=1 Tax=Campylobacter californiensis TaxID=1032243 RepID=UPI0014760AC9|nr:hypothetical protein [Campylobacter sp. RM12916]MBE3610487.1 hypothetical protein [Campylobacter sp. RM12916]